MASEEKTSLLTSDEVHDRHPHDDDEGGEHNFSATSTRAITTTSATTTDVSSAVETSLLDENEATTSGNKWTREQILTAISLSLMNVAINISFGIISPFYPAEAAKKGASATEIGLVFGVFQLVLFITAPFYGSFIQQIGAKYMFLSGSFILGGCNIAFGFLDRCPDGTIYVVMCFVCRTVEANGCSMVSTASFAIMASTFPKNVGKAMGTLEVFAGLGMVLGPSIGGALYGIGGYTVPFLVIGGLVWVTTVISYFVLPSIDEVPRMTGSIFSMLKIPGCVVIYFVTVACGMSLSFLDPTFSPWMLDTFSTMTVPTVGLIFMTGPGMYSLSAPIAGYISDKGYQASLSIIGQILAAIAFFFMGPNPLLSPIIPTAIWETMVAFVFLGFSVAASIIPVFPLTINIIRERGFEDNLQTFGLVSGFFQSGFSLGGFIGPTAAGYLAGVYGFAWSCSIGGLIVLLVGLMLLAYVLIMNAQGRWPPKDPNSKLESSVAVSPALSANGHSADYGSINA